MEPRRCRFNLLVRWLEWPSEPPNTVTTALMRVNRAGWPKQTQLGTTVSACLDTWHLLTVGP